MRTIILSNSLDHFLSSPFGEVQKLGLSDWLGSAVSGLGSVLGFGGTVYSSNASSNAIKYAADQSLAATQATNQANIDIANAQMAWEQQQIQEQNEYNSAASQVQRYIDAGINPYMAMLQSGTAGTQNQIATPVTPQLSTPTQAYELQAQAAQQKAQGIKDAISALASIQGSFKTASETKAQNIENMIKRQTAANDVLRSKYSTDLEKYQADVAKYAAEFEGRSLNNRLDQEASKALILERQDFITENQRRISDVTRTIQEEYGLKMSQVQYDTMQKQYEQIVASIANLWSQKRLTDANVSVSKAQVQSLIADVLHKNELVKSQRIANYVAESSADYIIQQAQYQSQLMGSDAEYRGMYNWQLQQSMTEDNKYKIAKNAYFNMDKLFEYTTGTLNSAANLIKSIIP